MIDNQAVQRLRVIANCGNHDALASKPGLELAERCDDCARGLLQAIRAEALYVALEDAAQIVSKATTIRMADSDLSAAQMAAVMVYANKAIDAIRAARFNEGMRQK